MQSRTPNSQHQDPWKFATRILGLDRGTPNLFRQKLGGFFDPKALCVWKMFVAAHDGTGYILVLNLTCFFRKCCSGAAFSVLFFFSGVHWCKSQGD